MIRGNGGERAGGTRGGGNQYDGAVARVLVVDDDPHIRDFVREVLEDEGHEVATAEHGGDALDRIRSASESAPDVIILDINMPVMDGPTFARTYEHVPVPPPHAGIIVTTAGREARRKCDELGAQGCLPKPFDLAHLVDEVQTLLDRLTA